MLRSEDKKLARVERLAMLHGPFVRFYPDGTEEAEDEDDAALDETIEDGEKAANPEFDKVRQEADQERANAAKARERAAQAETNLATAQADNEKLKQQLEEVTAKANAAGIEDVNLDESQYEGTDLQLVKAIKAVNKKIAVKDTEIAGLKKLAKQYEEREVQKEATAQRNQNYEKLLDDLDAEYGPDCRNEAVKKFNELAANGEIPKGNPVQATRVMERCYKEVKATISKKPAKKSTQLDTGSGGGARTNLTGVPLKKGSLDEVAAQAAQLVTSKAP